MYVCLCNGITDTQIKAAINEGHTTVKAIKNNLGAATQCGRCTSEVKNILKAENATSLTRPNIISGLETIAQQGQGLFYQIA